MSFVISFGRWGGFYFMRGFQTRVCLGWVALTYIPMDYDEVIIRALRQEKWDAILELANGLNRTNIGIIKPALLYQLGMLDSNGVSTQN